jgi:hypothetical protein
VFTTDCGQLNSDDQQLKCERAKFELEQAKKAAGSPTTAKPPATTKPPEPTISDGVYEVGVDIKSGKYKTSGSPDGCYWARLRTPGDILDNNSSNGPQVVIIRSSDGYVEFSGGCEWRRA